MEYRDLKEAYRADKQIYWHDNMVDYINWLEDKIIDSQTNWISVEDRPLFTIDENGHWVCTEDGDKEFIAAVEYNDSREPYKTKWWIRHCVVEDGVGLCVVGDDENEPAGYELSDVTHWMPITPPHL